MLAYGIHRSIVVLTRLFLSIRTSQVRVAESHSTPEPTCSDAPQGSVLSLIQFLIFSDDLPEVLWSSRVLFMDGIKLMLACYEYSELDQNPETLFQWSNDCDLPLNASKCSHISIGGDSGDIPTPVSGSNEANLWVWQEGVLALPTTRHRPDGAHTAPGHSYG